MAHNEGMEITFLGTGSGTPSRTRNVSGIVLGLPERGEVWLFDCGEGTQHQALRTPQVRLSQLTKIFITHLHGDHLYGLPGLLASRALAQGGDTPLTLYGPAGLAEYLRTCFQVGGTANNGFPHRVERLQPGPVCEDAAFSVVCAPVRHRIEAYAFAVIEKPQPGRFNVEAAQALGVPFGPLYGRLKAGETITLTENGPEIDGRTLIGPPRPGRRIVLSGDTAFAPAVVELARDADVLVHEATYRDVDRALADRAAHSTAVSAAETARQAGGVGALVLTHFSPRYDAEGGAQMGELLAEAQAIFPATRLAHDFLRIAVPRREPEEADQSGSVSR